MVQKWLASSSLLLTLLTMLHITGQIQSLRIISIGSNISSPSVTIINGKITCDNQECPADSTKCTVWRKNAENDVNTITTYRKCFDSTGNVTLSEQYDTDNRLAGAEVNSYTEATSSGSIIQCSDCTGASVDEILANERLRAAEFTKKMSEFAANMANMGNVMRQQMDRRMKNIFGRFY